MAIQVEGRGRGMDQNWDGVLGGLEPTPANAVGGEGGLGEGAGDEWLILACRTADRDTKLSFPSCL